MLSILLFKLHNNLLTSVLLLPHFTDEKSETTNKHGEAVIRTQAVDSRAHNPNSQAYCVSRTTYIYSLLSSYLGLVPLPFLLSFAYAIPDIFQTPAQTPPLLWRLCVLFLFTELPKHWVHVKDFKIWTVVSVFLLSFWACHLGKPLEVPPRRRPVCVSDCTYTCQGSGLPTSVQINRQFTE